jgi:hypothetical protein
MYHEKEKITLNFIKKELDVAKETTFWTSASSSGCPENFGWCSSGEMVDYEGLEISRDAPDESNQCLIASFNETNSLLLKADDCAKNKARTICEVRNFHMELLKIQPNFKTPRQLMCKRSECWKFKCPEEVGIFFFKNKTCFTL